MKHKAAVEAGIARATCACRRRRAEAELLDLVAELNADDEVDGILVQLPLPGQIDEEPRHPRRRSGQGRRRLPSLQRRPVARGHARARAGERRSACMALLDEYGVELEGAKAVVIGRSDIVGKPVALLLLHGECDRDDLPLPDP